MAYQAQQFRPIGIDENFSSAFQKGLISPQALMQALSQTKILNQNAQDQGAMNQAKINNLETLSQFRMSPSGQLRNLDPLTKALLGPEMLKAHGYDINGSQNNNGGGNIPQYYQQYVDKLKGDSNLGRQAIDSQALANEINKLDLSSLTPFSGAGGKLKSLEEKAKLLGSSFGIGSGPSEEYRNYDIFQNQQKNVIADMARKALATTIVPNYVKQNLYPLIDPTGGIWSDPTQVSKRLSALKDWANSYAQERTQAYKGGVQNYNSKSDGSLDHLSNDQLYEIYSGSSVNG